ncbi:MAG: hypothetical protein AAFO06_25080 [Cyanobacteria bacterium J06597_16]
MPTAVEANPLPSPQGVTETDAVLSEDVSADEITEADELPTQEVIEEGSTDLDDSSIEEEDASNEMPPEASEEKEPGIDNGTEGDETEDTDSEDDSDSETNSGSDNVPANGTFSPAEPPDGVSPISPQPGIPGGVVPATPSQSAPAGITPAAPLPATPLPATPPSDLPATPVEPMQVLPPEAPIAPMAPADPIEPAQPLIPDVPGDMDLETNDDFSPDEFSPDEFSPEDASPEDALPLEENGDPSEFPSSGVSADERLIGEGFTPFQLSYLAISGGLREEGIPGGGMLLSAYKSGDISAEDIVAAGAGSKRLGTAADDQEDYTKGVDRFLKILEQDTRSS